MQLAAYVWVFQVRDRCPKLFLWHLAVWGKHYNFYDLLLPNGSNDPIFQEDKNQHSGIFYDLFFFWMWNEWRIINPAWESTASWLHLLGVVWFGVSFVVVFGGFLVCLFVLGGLVLFVCYFIFFFLSLLCTSKLNCWGFLHLVCRQHILQSVLTAVQDECKLNTN